MTTILCLLVMGQAGFVVCPMGWTCPAMAGKQVATFSTTEAAASIEKAKKHLAAAVTGP